MDIVRVLRVVEYVGPRDQIEKQIRHSIHGERSYNGITIRVATLGTFPEILERENASNHSQTEEPADPAHFYRETGGSD